MAVFLARLDRGERLFQPLKIGVEQFLDGCPTIRQQGDFLSEYGKVAFNANSALSGR